MHGARSRFVSRIVLTFAFVFGLAVVATQSAQAQTFSVLYNFAGGPSDGTGPYGGLLRDKAGNLYGTTSSGGSSFFHGTVFKVDTTGTETVLYNFCSEGGGYCTDGSLPFSDLLQDAAGNLYGTTYDGGEDPYGYCAYQGRTGCGVVFKVDTTGNETVLYDFVGGSTDGCFPMGGLIRDKGGNLYGTTSRCGPSNNGTVFELSESGTEIVLHSFAGSPSDGAFPSLTSLLMDAKGNIYGATYYGGAYGGDSGTVYKLSKTGTLTILHSFGRTGDGCNVYGTPAMDRKGNLYGTTEFCGSSERGTVWKLTKNGKETVLHNFTGSDGAFPSASVVMDAKGNLYGDTPEDTSGLGTVYKLNTKGKLTVLHNFSVLDGAGPARGLLRDAKGNLYGTAVGGGNSHNCNGSGCGTVWKLTP